MNRIMKNENISRDIVYGKSFLKLSLVKISLIQSRWLNYARQLDLCVARRVSAHRMDDYYEIHT